VELARGKYHDVVHTGVDEDGVPYEWTEWGKYSPDGMCIEPWEAV
jgi:hypothetical protein